ncbi:MAG: thiolase family protein [Actinobacteria bacterium]|jgi:acetyl-CoA acyltransferase|nr:thiolase family protein [Actinomycetota bacterium]
MSRTVVLVDAVRTPFGKAGSLYAGTRADDLMVRAIRGLLERNPKVDPASIEDVAIAAATQTGDQGMNIGRSAALLSGLPNTVPGYSVDRWCAGAMTAVTTIAGAIAMGTNEIAIAGGVEHMGNHPIGEGLDPNPRYLAERIVEQDALAMGATAERLHDRFPQLTKERADRYALNSQLKTAKAYEAGKIQRDLIPTAARSAELGWTVATVDEPPRPQTTMEGLAGLKTPFRPAGRVTPGNSSGLNDGATAALLASEDKALELGLTIKAKMVTYAFAGVEPEIMGYGPVPSTLKALKQAGLKIEDIGAFEINEAFAVQVIAFLDHFGIADDDPRVNPYGGAIAVGHPLASSGVRLMLNLARTFEEHPEVRYGITTMCIGLGMGGTVIWENPNYKGAK